MVKSKGKSIWIKTGEETETKRGNPFNLLRKILNTFDIGPTPLSFPPFLGGGVGYLGYDLCHFMEKVPSTAKDDLNIPDLFLAFYDRVLIIDHLLNKIFLAALLLPGEKNPLKRKINELKKRFFPNPHSQIIKAKAKIPEKIVPESFPIRSNFTKSRYLKAVEKAKEYIAAGDIYQVNLSQRFQTRLAIPPFKLYQRLQRINPAPFGAYLNFGEIVVASSSPERFLKVTGKKVETRPIKGTRPRGKDKEEDERLARKLLESEKDRAELIMIVDLERNDLGKVCRYGSVRVRELVELEAYPTVFHTVSTVEGELYPGKDRVDLLKATFPGGSITGAPKIRAMEIIDELEPTKRGIYTGALGYFGFNQTMDLNIVIRTFLIKEDQVFFQVGGGIVADSDPQREYQETLDKAKALIQSLHQENRWNIKSLSMEDS
jgi:para-aminobenzoate synthetase component 1